MLLALALAACRGGPEAAPGLQRWIWVNRWDWTSAADIRRVMADCADAGFTSVLFQVRGNGTALYASSLEPWSDRFGHRDPGFDPLGVAIDEAHGRGLELHAWVNLMPGWQGAKPPTARDQLWLQHPDWFMADAAGQREPLAAGRYASLNPCLPEVRDYLVAVCGDLLRRYPIDGLHIDYVRFVDADYGGDYPRDVRTLAIYREETGNDAAASPPAFEAWKTEVVTRLVRAISAEVRRSPRRVLLSAAVIADLQIARDRHNQDWSAWTRERLLGALFPMNYTADDGAFVRVAREGIAAAAATPLVVGIGAYQHQNPRQTLEQMDAALRLGADGVAVYAYAKVFGDKSDAWRYSLSGWNTARRYPR